MSDEVESRKALKIYGRVQGVGFRWYTRRQAHQLGLRGYVRNCYDGTVEVMLAGPVEAVDEMCRWLEVGPPGARVDRTERLPPSDQPFEDFDVSY